MTPIRVLVSPLYGPEHTDPVFARFPDVDFVRLPAEGPFPEEARRADALLFAGMGKPRLRELLAAAPALRWIHTGSAGFDWVMVPEIEARGIVVSRSAEVMTVPMAEFAFGAMLSHAKHLPLLREQQAARVWNAPMHAELFGRTLLIAGAGAIGRRLAHLARAFGMRVIGTKRDPSPLPDFDEVRPARDLDALLPEADFVVLTCPLTPETRGMLGEAQLRAMRPHAYLVNLARGALIDTDALVSALREGRLAGACLDAFEVEPLPTDSPLWAVPNLFVSPHGSYRSPAVRFRVVEEFGANLARVLAGEPPLNTMRHAQLGY